jgi:hypothetical protein
VGNGLQYLPMVSNLRVQGQSPRLIASRCEAMLMSGVGFVYTPIESLHPQGVHKSLSPVVNALCWNVTAAPMPLPCHASVVSHHLNPRYACAHPTISEVLLEAVKQAGAGEEARIGRKLPGTSARFAPGGQAVMLNELAKLWK